MAPLRLTAPQLPPDTPLSDHSSSSSPPSSSLLKSLIALTDSLPSLSATTKLCQCRNASSILRRIHVLSLLFQELHDSPSACSTLSPPVVLCFRELSTIVEKVKAWLESSALRSCTWQILEHEPTSRFFYDLGQDMANALDILPLRLLDVSEEMREQVHLLYSQLRKAKPLVDQTVEKLRSSLLSYLKNFDRGVEFDPIQTRKLFGNLRLSDARDCQKEIQLLQDEIKDQAGTGGVTVVWTINNLISFVKFGQGSLYGTVTAGDSPRLSCELYSEEVSTSGNDFAFSGGFATPDEFRCPISLDLMRDPVVVASGHTYDRTSILKWLESGHCTCPKSGQKLLHVSLIPNYAVRNLIRQWCDLHNIPFDGDDNSSMDTAKDHISARQAVLEATRETAAYLVGKLAMGCPELQRQVAYELRLLAKCGMENRICIAEAGAIPFLVRLLSSPDYRTQENAVTALLNLSICDNNKTLIVAAGALEAVVDLVRAGASMEARENAAATLFSLSVVNEYKVSIGSKSHAIPALVNLMRIGSPRGKKDAATALFNLSIFIGNKSKVVAAGAIPLLVDLLTDERAGITDDSLALLAVLAGIEEGLTAIRETKAIPVLVDILRLGSVRGKENSIAVLLSLCRSGGEATIKSVLDHPAALPSLQSIAAGGSSRGKRKAASLLKLIDKYRLTQLTNR